MRALLAWWVVVFHFARGFVEPGIVNNILSSGYLAVDLFFVLSGYVLARRYVAVPLDERKARRSFWVNRFARVIRSTR